MTRRTIQRKSWIIDQATDPYGLLAYSGAGGTVLIQKSRFFERWRHLKFVRSIVAYVCIECRDESKENEGTWRKV